MNFGIQQALKLVDRKLRCPVHRAGVPFLFPFILACQPEQFKERLESAMKDHVPSEQAKTSHQRRKSRLWLIIPTCREAAFCRKNVKLLVYFAILYFKNEMVAQTISWNLVIQNLLYCYVGFNTYILTPLNLVFTLTCYLESTSLMWLLSDCQKIFSGYYQSTAALSSVHLPIGL